MGQQMVNGSYYHGSETFTNRMTPRYAVVNPPFAGKHTKPQDPSTLHARKLRWIFRNELAKRAAR